MIKLAKRILSVTANSASCERLFSVFGNTLTKLRNRTGTKTLHNLAEIKLHIRNQHQEKKTGARICKIFEQRATPAAPPTFDPPILPHGMQIDPELESDSDSEVDEDEEDGGFSDVMERHIDMLQDDEGDNFEPAAESFGWEPCTIFELFDFSKTHWTTLYSKTALRSFDEELQAYELLDLDAQGEDDVDVDDVTASVLIE